VGGRGRVGLGARFKPLHLGHAAVLEGLVAQADELLVGLGSVNRHDVRNPWTADESAEMIRRVIGEPPHVRLLRFDDLGDGPRWARMVADAMGRLDLFVSANPWVRELMEPRYAVAHPVEFVPPERRVALDATRVRRAMARNEDWRSMLPEPVARYLDENGLVARFTREFGLETLALELPPPAPGLLD
jgi:nicotinamide-nucleotide adenylyltransferase